MSLDDKQRHFLAKREKLKRFWPLAGSVLLVVLLALFIWVYLRTPLLVNPFEVASRLEAGTIEESTLVLMAGLLPVMFLVCFGLLAALILFMFSAFSTEKKHLRVIDLLLYKNRSEK